MRCAEGRGAGSPSALAFVVLLVACGGDAPAAGSRGQPIAIGAYALTIERVQPAPVPGPPISTFREQPGREALMLTVRWAGLEELDPMSRLAFAEKYLEDRLTVVDSTGARSAPTGAMQSAVLFMNDPGDNWRDWIVVFHVPEEAGGRVLEIENPEPGPDQPSRIAIDLDR